MFIAAGGTYTLGVIEVFHSYQGNSQLSKLHTPGKDCRRAVSDMLR